MAIEGALTTTEVMVPSEVVTREVGYRVTDRNRWVMQDEWLTVACSGRATVRLRGGVACLSSSTELVMSTREESVTPGNRCEEWGGEGGGRKGKWRERKAEE